MNKWQLAREIGTKLACIEATPAVLKLLAAAGYHAEVS